MNFVAHFFIHYTHTDSCGEDGHFLSKVNHIATLDILDRLFGAPGSRGPCHYRRSQHTSGAKVSWLASGPFAAFIIDMSKGWVDSIYRTFTETAVSKNLGNRESKYLMRLQLGHALRLEKFCA